MPWESPRCGWCCEDGAAGREERRMPGRPVSAMHDLVLTAALQYPVRILLILMKAELITLTWEENQLCACIQRNAKVLEDRLHVFC